MEILETERLRLRPWRMEDLEDFYAYCKDPETGPMAGWKPHESLEESRRILESWVKGSDTDELWAIEELDVGRAIGSIGLHQDGKRQNIPGCKMVGYVLAREHWGKGYMPEAVRAIQDHAFRTEKLKLLTINHFAWNKQSQRVIEKSGFQFEGTLRRGALLHDGKVADLRCYSMTAAAYWLRRAKEQGFSLVLPEELPAQAVQGYQESWQEEKLVPTALDRRGRSYPQWLADSIAMRSQVPAGFVTATSYLLADREQNLLGALDLRHQLNQRLLETGGHIGYGIRPGCRGGGLAPLMLALGLEKARERGIGRVLVTCNEDNLASAATIEDCGGELENSFREEDGALVRRYWIELS